MPTVHRIPPCATVWVVVCLVIGLALAAAAQTSSGRIVGSITDEQGAVIVNAKVQVKNVGTNAHWDTTTQSDGTYQVVSLPVGSYTVTVEHEGFAKATSSPQVLNINQTLHIDATLKVSSTSNVIEVQSEASQVETSSPTVGGTITGAPVENLPLNGRNVLDLALTQPGVTPAQPSVLGAAAGVPSGEFSVAGGRDNAVTYLLDGGNNTSVTYGAPVANPNPDMVAEFRVLSNNYTAEYGRSAGGVVSVVTKSGTNQFHGSAFDYWRNDAMNANTYFNNEAGLPRPVLNRNQFGGTFGGPIVKDRLFFFFGYQGQQQNSVTVGNQLTVYTPSELQGDFSHSVNGGPDPGVVAFLQGHPYFQSNPALAAQAIIDPTRIDPVAQSYIGHNLIPVTSTGIMVPNGPAYNNNNDYTFKVDYNLRSSDRFSVTFDYFNNPLEYPFLPGAAPNVPGFPGKSNFTNYFVNASWIHVFSASKINDFHFNVQQNDNQLNFPGAKQPGPADLGINITTDQVTGPPQILLNNSGPQIGFNLNGPADYTDTTYVFSDTFTAIHGHHTIKAGGSVALLQNNAYFAYTVDGQYMFYGGTTGNDRADFLLGAPDLFAQYPKAYSAIRSNQFGVFVQDEWRVKPQLVLTLGLRWEYASPNSDPQNRNYMIVPGKQSVKFPNAPLGLLFPGDPGAPSNGVNYPDWNNWAPRIGFAWDVFGNGRTSIRGGGGVFFDAILGQFNQYQNGTPPFYAAAFFCSFPAGTFCGGPQSDPGNGPYTYLSDPYGTAGVINPFPSTPPTSQLDFVSAGYIPFGPASVFINPNLRTPYVYQYNLSIQQQAGRNMVFEMGYVGSSSHKLIAQYDGNPFIIGTTDRPLNLQPGLQIPGAYAEMPATFGNVANANYNGFLASLTRNMSEWGRFGKVFFTASYTWSHTIDYADGFVRNSNAVPTFDTALFRASGDSDIRHRFVFSGGWELPFARTWASAPKRLTSGWNLYPIISAQSGLPMDVLSGLAVNGASPGPSGAGDQNLVRPNWAGGAPIALDPHQVRTFVVNGTAIVGHFAFDPTPLYTPDCYASSAIPGTAGGCPAPTYGTLPRNFFRGPDRVNFDLALEKRTQLNERLSLDFRAEFFNVLNHTEWRSPVASTPITSPQLGQITSTYDPRIGQLAVRLSF